MSWLTPIDRKSPHPLDWWDRLDGALRRSPGFHIIVALVATDYAWQSGRWILFGLMALLLIAVALGEFGPKPRKEAERSLQ